MGEDPVVRNWRQWQEEKIEQILDELMTELEDDPDSLQEAAASEHPQAKTRLIAVPAQTSPIVGLTDARSRSHQSHSTVVLRANAMTPQPSFRQAPPKPPTPPLSAVAGAEAWPSPGLFSDRQLLLTAIALLAGTAALGLAHWLRTPNLQAIQQQAFLAHLQESLTALESEAVVNQAPSPTTAATTNSKPLPTVSIAPPPTSSLDRPKVALPPPAASLIPPSRSPLAVVRAPVATLPPPPPVLPPAILAAPDIPMGSAPATLPPPPSTVRLSPVQPSGAIAPAHLPAAPVASGLRLKGVMVMGNDSSAMFSLDGSVQTPVRIGEAVGTSGWRLKRVDSQSVVLERNGKQRVMGIDSGL
jgi:hypothetical protein